MSGLPIIDPLRWSVRTKYRRQTKKQIAAKQPTEEIHHELTFGGVAIEKGKGEGELERLRSLAIIFNRGKVVPRRLAIECAADAPSPRAYLQKISGLR